MPLEFMDYRISDNLIEQNISEKSRIQEILIFAAKQEQRIHEYYMALSEEYKDTEIGYIWECFARESLIHKEFFEKRAKTPIELSSLNGFTYKLDDFKKSLDEHDQREQVTYDKRV